jgi:rhodanese-related sulfurtransferase
MQKTFDERLADAKAEVSNVSAHEANNHKIKGSNILFLDPRDPSDIPTTGIIPGAINVSLGDITEKPADELPETLTSHKGTIVTACQGGPMGAIAAHELKRRGFDNVMYIENGTQGWLDAGFPTIR